MTETYKVAREGVREAYVVSRCAGGWNIRPVFHEVKSETRIASASDVIDFFYQRPANIFTYWSWTPDVPRGHELDLANNDHTQKKGDIKLMLNLDGAVRFGGRGGLPRQVLEFYHRTCRLRTVADDEVVLHTDRRTITASWAVFTAHSFHDCDLIPPNNTIREAIDRHLPITGISRIVLGYASHFAFTWSMFKSLLGNACDPCTQFCWVVPFVIQHADTLEIRTGECVSYPRESTR